MGPLPAHASSARDIEQRARRVVTTLLVGGALDIHQVAEALGTSVRTLQRQMRAAGLTYAGVVRQARCRAALRMLEDPGRKVCDVARTLGYADPAHFTRAFRHWTGLSPLEHRRRTRSTAIRISGRAKRRAPPRKPGGE
jgi:AraC-like DNA-binding protein